MTDLPNLLPAYRTPLPDAVLDTDTGDLIRLLIEEYGPGTQDPPVCSRCGCPMTLPRWSQVLYTCAECGL